MKILDIINMVSDELRDARETKYSRTSILYKLKEALTQFASESKILKHSVSIRPSDKKAIYTLPVYGKNYSIVDENGNDQILSNVPTYLSLIRLGWRDKNNEGLNELIRPNSTFERDEVGQIYNRFGTPQYHYNDNLSFYKFGLWPVPNAAAIDANNSDKLIQIDYVRDVLYYVDGTYSQTLSRTDALEDNYVDDEIPVEFTSKIYLLVCYLRLKNSVDPTDVQKAEKYKALYEEELLSKALESGAHMDRYNQMKVQQ